MRVRSVNVGKPLTLLWKDRPVTTGIFKSPVCGDVHVSQLNLEGDGQADLRVHGGREKAVYAYPWEHYAAWQNELPELCFSLGAFGENLTVEGLAEEEVEIGDQFQIGNTVLTVTKPRTPCYKLGIRFGRDDMVKRFALARRPGMYFRVEEEGTLQEGAAVRRAVQSGSGITVMAMFDMMLRRA